MLHPLTLLQPSCSPRLEKTLLGMPVHPGATGETSGLLMSLSQQTPCVLSEKGHCPSQLLHVSHPFFLGSVCCFCSVCLFLLDSSCSGDWAGSFSWLVSVGAIFRLGELSLGLCIWRGLFLGSSGMKLCVSLIAVLVGVSWPFCSISLSFAWTSHAWEW